MHVMFIRNMANVPWWGEHLNKNVKSNVFMQRGDSFSVIYIDYLSRLGVDAESSNFMQENRRNKSFQKVC